MSRLEYMDVFGSVEHTDDNGDLPALTGRETTVELLDYMVLVIVRRLRADKAFKGGYMLNQLLGVSSRMTYDVDFSIEKPSDYKEVKKVLVEIAENFWKLGIISSYQLKDNIEERKSGGIDFYDVNGKKVLGVDVGLHDLGWGIRNYDFSIVTLDGFEIERMLADKTIAILSRKRFRRTKDLYDFYAVTSMFDFNYQKLAKYIEIRGGAEWDNIPFSEVVLMEYHEAWAKLNLLNIEGDTLEKPEFGVALQRFYAIALPLKNGEMRDNWSSKICNFVKQN